MVLFNFMKIRNAFITILFVATVALTASQIDRVNALNSNSPITSPITPIVPVSPTPTTRPITPPIPTKKPTPTPTPKPVIKYSVSGFVTRRITVTYQLKGKIYTYSYIMPVQNATIKAINQQTQKYVSVKTDQNGKYSLLLEKGKYLISVSTVQKLVFIPSGKYIDIKGNISQINFQGK
jgi:hypothetical protein